MAFEKGSLPAFLKQGLDKSKGKGKAVAPKGKEVAVPSKKGMPKKGC